MKNYTRIFISYCHDNINRGEVQAIINWMNSITDNIDVISDFKLIGGENLKQFMNQISEVDGILILGTPDYKSKAESRNDTSGVYTEYNAIKSRLDFLEELKKSSIDTDILIRSFTIF